MLDRLLTFCLTQRFLVLAGAVFLVAAGALSWRGLTLDAVPDITTNQVQIFTETGGMSPLEVERLVTFPIETALAGTPGMIEVRSLTQFGLSIVTVTFRDDVDVYFARSLVNERLGSVADDLPDGVSKPVMGPVSTGLGEVYMYDLDSKSVPMMELRSLQDWLIAPQLKSVPGVAEVNAMDGSEKQFQVVLRPTDLAALQIRVQDVVEALQRNNQNAGGGLIEQNGERIMVRSVGQASTMEDLGNSVIRADEGVPVLVRDVADVRLGTPILTGISTRDGRASLVVVVMMLKGANGQTVSTAVHDRIQEIRSQLPDGVTLETLYNRSDLVGEVLHTVEKSLLEGAALVVVVLVLLLGNVRGALVVALAIPLAMVCAVIGMNRFGISGNLMSLGAIDFGLIVDGAVVMIENSVRRVAEARAAKGATLTREEVRHRVLEASKEVAKPTAFAVTIITVVYLPILALEGTEGKMFRPMAFTVVFALLGALLLTMTLIPAIASLTLSGDTREGKNPVMASLARVYEPALLFALRRRSVVTAGAAALLGVSLVVFGRLGAEFVPQLDEGSAVIQPVRMRNVDASESVKLVQAVERKILEIPEVWTVFSRTGTPDVATDPMPLSLTDSIIIFNPRSQWRPGMTKARLLEEIRGKAEEVPGQGYSYTQPIQMRFSELVAGVKADIGIKVFGEDLRELKSTADEIAEIVQDIPGAEDVEVEQVNEVPVLQIDIDRDATSRLGLSVEDIQQVVRTALAGDPIGQVVEDDRRFALTVQFPDGIRNDPKSIANLPIATLDGGAVPLSSVARIENVPAPAQISRETGKRRVIVQLNVRGRDIGSFVTEAKSRIAANVQLGQGTFLSWGGQFENLQRASNRLAIVVPVALAMIFLLLFWAFGSVKQALLIFSAVPLAVTGGIFALAARGMPFSITAGVGFIALSGVAVMNGVVLVSAINRLRSRGRPVKDAVIEGATERLRPVLMTALVAAIGFIPMAVNTGLGAEVQRPLATVVIGGVLSATLLTLLVLPALYLSVEQDARAAR